MLKSGTPGEQAIRKFWDAHLCGDHQIADLQADCEAFSARCDRFCYRREGHILSRLDSIDFKRSELFNFIRRNTDGPENPYAKGL